MGSDLVQGQRTETVFRAALEPNVWADVMTLLARRDPTSASP